MRKRAGWLLRKLRRQLMGCLPTPLRNALLRNFVHCDASPSPQLVLKLAQTREELCACFHLLHDSYVSSGFMKPDPSGMRVTIYHALPTTSTQTFSPQSVCPAYSQCSRSRELESDTPFCL